MKNIAIIANTGLGDALWMMVVANNFAKEKNKVTIYNNYLCHLAALFPHVIIYPYSTWNNNYDFLIRQQNAPSFEDAIPNVVINKEEFNPTKSYVMNLRDLCQKKLGLLNAGTQIGIQVPQHWSFRHFPQRIVIHPSSANVCKNWPQTKFLSLAEKLKEIGLNPYFILPASEANDWNPLLTNAQLPKVISLEWISLTQFLYKSGFFIGNDNSAGHIASCLNIPTLTLFDRKSRSRLYRPDWGPGKVVLPCPILMGRVLRNAFWKQFLSVGRVFRAFKKLAGIGKKKGRRNSP